MAKFAEYGFNKSHTAAYGWVTYQTAFLKTYYPTEFMTSILSCDVDNSDKVLTYLEDCKRMSIVVLPPCVNDSSYGFTMKGPKTLRFGLGALKGVGQSAAELISKEREKGGAFESVPEFIARIEAKNLNKKIMESLIKAGAFDALGSNRAEILDNSDVWLKSIGRSAEQKEMTGGGLFNFDEEESAPVTAAKTRLTAQPLTIQNYDPLKVPTCTQTQKPAHRDVLAGVQLKPTKPWSYLELAANELAVYGFYRYAHPAFLYQQDLSAFSACGFQELPTKLEPPTPQGFRKKPKPVRIAGLITNIFEKRKQEDNSKFAVYVLSDGLNTLEVTLYSEQYAALSKPFVIGDLIWAECGLKQGIGDNTVRATAMAMGHLSDLRRASASSCLLRVRNPEWLKQEGYKTFFQKLSTHPGKTSLVVEVEMPEKKVLCRMDIKDQKVDLDDLLFREVSHLGPGMISFEWCAGQVT